METEPGVFDIVPQWEQVTEEDILTPREVFDLVAKEGYKVCLLTSLRRGFRELMERNRLTMPVFQS